MKRFALPALVVLFAVAALALMSISVRTTSAQDVSTTTLMDGPATAVSNAASGGADGPGAKPATPTHTLPSTTPTNEGLNSGEDTSEADKGGCCGG